MTLVSSTTPRVPKGAQPAFFEQPALEAMHGMFVVLLEEICVLRDRLDSYEKLGAAGIVVTPDALDAYTPDEATEKLREKRRQETIRRALRPVVQLQRAAINDAQSRYHSAATKLAEQEI